MNTRDQFVALVEGAVRKAETQGSPIAQALYKLAITLAREVDLGRAGRARARAALLNLIVRIDRIRVADIGGVLTDLGLAPRGTKLPQEPRFALRRTKRAVKKADKKVGLRKKNGGGGRRKSARDRIVFPLLDANGVVVAEQEFELRVGLTEQLDPDVAGDPFVVPSDVGEEFALIVQVVAVGFTPRAGESLRQVLSVTRDNPYPNVLLHLTARKQSAKVVSRFIQAIYSINAQTIGVAVRPISVVNSATLAGTAAVPPLETAHSFRVPVATTAPDLTVRLLRDRSLPGALTWSIETRFADVHVPPTVLSSDIGTEPSKFARQVMNGVNARLATPDTLEGYLNGVAKTIATDHVPNEFWRIFLDVAKRSGGPPTLLLLSDEPYVPWELAHVNAAPDPGAPPFLGAQAVVGRWPIRGKNQPPPESIDIAKVAVVSGIYNKPGWQRLTAAEEEATTLANTRFGPAIATAVDATSAQIVSCLRGKPPADLLHFAVHGIYDPTGNADGIVLVDGKFLDPLDVRGAVLARRPFVFLNACQVGQGNMMLGDYAGLAEAFLFAGASGVIAPLWSIKDTLARDAALVFYASESTKPAYALREERAKASGDLPQLALKLAYQFFGHPALSLRLPAQPQ